MPTKNYNELRAARQGAVAPENLIRLEADARTLDATLRLGIAVRNAREEAGLTQTELANRLSVAQSALSRIEAGRTNVSVRTLVMIAVALGVGIALALGDQEATLVKGGTP